MDDAFYSNHMYDSKLCGAAQYYKQDCGWGCKKEVKKGASAEVYNKKQWGGFEKFCLFFWSFVGKSNGRLIHSQLLGGKYSLIILHFCLSFFNSRCTGLGCTQATPNDVPRRCDC